MWGDVRFGRRGVGSYEVKGVPMLTLRSQEVMPLKVRLRFALDEVRGT